MIVIDTSAQVAIVFGRRNARHSSTSSEKRHVHS
jgi:uncharacterized protein with PIN domain